MQRKIYEDYEPISNIGVCAALVIVLGTATYMGAFSDNKKSDGKQNLEPVKVIQKADVLKLNQKNNNQKERSN